MFVGNGLEAYRVETFETARQAFRNGRAATAREIADRRETMDRPETSSWQAGGQLDRSKALRSGLLGLASLILVVGFVVQFRPLVAQRLGASVVADPSSVRPLPSSIRWTRTLDRSTNMAGA